MLYDKTEHSNSFLFHDKEFNNIPKHWFAWIFKPNLFFLKTKSGVIRDLESLK